MIEIQYFFRELCPLKILLEQVYHQTQTKHNLKGEELCQLQRVLLHKYRQRCPLMALDVGGFCFNPEIDVGKMY
jgi:hypothetical protein